MAFCLYNATERRKITAKTANRIAEDCIERGWYREGMVGWCRFIKAPTMRPEQWFPDRPAITAPGAVWIQLYFGNEGGIYASYSIIGLSRDREQHTRELAPKIRVLKFSRGPSNECAEWMAQYSSEPGEQVFTGNQRQTVRKFFRKDGMVWVQRLNNKSCFPFKGYWMEGDGGEGEIYVPRPAE